MLKNFLKVTSSTAKALVGVLGEKFVDKITQVMLGYCPVFAGWEVDLLVLDLVKALFLGGSQEWCVSKQNLKENNAKSPPINRLTVAAFRGHLWRHVEEGAKELM